MMIAVTTSVAVVTGCAPASTVPVAGHVTGVVQIRGSVIPITPAEAKVTATLVGGTPADVYTVETSNDGSFAFDLPAGAYELSAVLTKRNIGDVATPQTVTVTTGANPTVNLWVNYP